MTVDETHAALAISGVVLLYKVPFPGVTADTLIFVLQMGKADDAHIVNITEYGKTSIQQPQAGDLLERPDHTFEYFENAETMQLINKLNSSSNTTSLGNVFESTSGFGGKSQLIQEVRTSRKQIPTLKGDSIGRYEMRKGYWFDFKPENITGRTTDVAKLGASPKLLLRKTGDSIIATYDDSGVFPEQSLYFLYNNHTEIDAKFFLGVLNSRLLTVYYRAKSLTNKESIAQVKKVDLDKLPIPLVNLSVPQDRVRHDRMVALVEQMLELHKRPAVAKSQSDRELYQRQIDATDREIDKLVYELYGLTEEEIAVVERSG